MLSNPTSGERPQGFCSVECVMTWLMFGGTKQCLICNRKIKIEGAS